MRTGARPALSAIVGCAVVLGAAAIGAAGCGDEEKDDSAAEPVQIEATVPEATVADGENSGPVAEFDSPENFWCLEEEPDQAQVTIGWRVPSAEAVAVTLDGEEVHSGIRNKLPFTVQAGDPPEVGTTVVFPCGSGDTHEIGVEWSLRNGERASETVTIQKADS